MRCPGLHEIPSPAPGKTGWPWTEESPRQETKLAGQSWPRVSIVTPSYNQGQFLEETIRSVLLQGYPDLEYVILDGGSTDGSLEIIRRYEPWLAYWVSEPDRGQTHAINKGLAHATGDIIAYINTDDCYLPGAIPAAAQEFRATVNAGMVYGTALIVDEEGRALRPWEAQRFDLSVMLTVGSVVPQSACFFSKNAVKAAGPLNEEWELIMDYDFCIRVGMQFPTVCMERTLATFRSHAQSKTRLRFEVMAKELIDFVTSFTPEQLPPPEWRRIRRATMSRIYYELALEYVRQGRGERSKALKQLAKSVVLYPRFAASRPLQTAHVAKAGLSDYLRATASQVRELGKRTSW